MCEASIQVIALGKVKGKWGDLKKHHILHDENELQYLLGTKEHILALGMKLISVGKIWPICQQIVICVREQNIQYCV